jgi:hypothetical protein
MSQNSGVLSVSREQIQELNRELSRMRHQINNHLSLMLAAAEMIQRKPESTPQWVARLTEQPPKISDEVEAFSQQFERTFGLKNEEEPPFA